MQGNNPATRQSAMSLDPGWVTFDPVELLSSLVPFADPFSFDDRRFRAEDEWLVWEAGTARYTSEAYQPSTNHPSDDIPTSPDNDLSSQAPQDTQAQQPGVLPAPRTRLTASQAIHIYNMGQNRLAGAARLLAVEHSITPKAVRDIWSGKSWSGTTGALD